jgi:predicted nucleotidyltransferase
MNKKEIIQTIIDYLKKYGVKEISLFGSFVRNEMTAESDIDVMVEYPRGITLLDIVKMRMELAERVGRKVDLVDKEAVYPKVMEYIMRDLQTVYHA